MREETGNRNHVYLLTLAILLNIITLGPLLQTGYLGDDVYHSVLRGYLMEQNASSLLKASYATITTWIREFMRFIPIQTYFYWVFYYITNLLAYKVCTLALISLNLLLFYYLLKMITRSQIFAILPLLFLPSLFQFRMFHDPILGFFWMQQVLFLFIFGSLILLYKFLRSGKKLFFICSVFLYVTSLLTYESAFIYFFFHVLVICFGPEKRSAVDVFKLSLPYAFCSLILLVITAATKFHFGIPLQIDQASAGIINSPSFWGNNSRSFAMAYSPNFDFTFILLTFTKQVVAALPLSYYIFNPAHLFSHSRVELFLSQVWPKISVFILSSGIFYFVARRLLMEPKFTERGNRKALFWVGILFLLLPATLISLSPRYQQEIFWGVGHLPIYFSYFGTAAIAAFALISALDYTTRTFERKAALLLISFLAIANASVTALNFGNNRTVVRSINSAWLYPRKMVEQSLKLGLFRQVPEGSVLLVDGSHPWDFSAFYLLHSGVKLAHVAGQGHYFDLPQIHSKAPEKNQNMDSIQEIQGDGKTYYLRYEAETKERGYALIAEITSLQATNSDLIQALADKVVIYVKENENNHKEIFFNGNWLEMGTSQPFSIKAQGTRSTLKSKEIGWAMYHLKGSGKLLDLTSLRIEFRQDNNPQTL